MPLRRDIEDARFKHVLAAHPYEGFPIDRIEQAVAAVPLQSYPDSERHLLGFGVSHAYWCANDTAACSNCCWSPNTLAMLPKQHGVAVKLIPCIQALEAVPIGREVRSWS